MKGHYLSPILVKESKFPFFLKFIKAIEMGSYNPKHNSFKSDVFSLGMTMLHAALLEPLDFIYRYKLDKEKLDFMGL